MNRSKLKALVSNAVLPMLLAVAWTANAQAELFVSVQDGKQIIDKGVMKIAAEGEDTLALIELTKGKVVLHSQIAVPASVIGPPTSVAVTPDGSLALVTAGFKRDPANASKSVENDKVSLVYLNSRPPRILDEVTVGKAPGGVSISPDGKLALVANHGDGTVSVLSIEGTKVSVVDQLLLGDAKSGPMHPTFTPDGKRALVTRDGDHRVTVLAVDGVKVAVTKRDIFPGQRPDCIDIRGRGDLAVVANIGKGVGDADTLSLIDLTVEPPRVVDTVSVGQTPESVFFSPDGRYVGVNVMNGSNKPTDVSYHNPQGKFVILKVSGKHLMPVASTPVGVWAQGFAFSADGRTVLIQNTHEQEIQVVRIKNEKLTDTGQRLALKGSPAAIRLIPSPPAKNP